MFTIKATWNRIKRYTPVVTKVEDWIGEETRLGVAIAIGSQDESSYSC